MIIDKDKFIKCYKNLIKNLKTDSSNVIFSYTSKFENENFEKLLREGNNKFKNPIMWIRKSKKNKFLSLGTIQEHNLSDQNKVEFNSMIETFIQNSISINLSDQKNIPMFIGGQNFNIKINNSNIWEDVPVAKYIVPEILLMKDNDKLTITHFFSVVHDVQKIIHTIESNYIYLINKIESNKYDKTEKINIHTKKHFIDENIFKRKIEKIKSYIKDSVASKVVLSNILSYKIDMNLSYDKLLLKMSVEYPDCAIFYYNFNNSGVFFGASPENILSKDDNNITIDALAGSASSENLNLLLDDKKIDDEHSFVTSGIKESLKSINIKGKLHKRSILKLKNIAHLKTVVSAKINSNSNPLNILDSLVPTPALSGYPKESSMNIINNIEDHERGWYAGPVGWINSNMNCKFFAGLRSAYIHNNKIYFYAGAGIIIDSNADEEWNEILNKINSIHRIVHEQI